MKVSYSKVLVHGVITTTLLMAMSCQKKGTARGVQPQTATNTSTPETKINVEEPQLGMVPGAAAGTGVMPKVEVSKTEPPKVADTSSTETTHVTPKACPESIVKASIVMNTLYKKIVAEEKLSTTPETDKIKDYTAYHQLCLDWPKLFPTEKIESCGGYVYVAGIPINFSRNAKSTDTACVKFATVLKDLTGQNNEIALDAAKKQAAKMKSLRAENMVVSTEAKEMFNKENTGWKMFIVDGGLQTDSAKLTDALKAEKVACTVKGASLDKYTTGQNVILSFSSSTELISTDEADQVKKGVELSIRIKATAIDATLEETAKAADEKLVMSCSNLDYNNLNVELLKKALGQHITIAKVSPAKATEEKVQVEVKK